MCVCESVCARRRVASQLHHQVFVWILRLQENKKQNKNNSRFISAVDENVCVWRVCVHMGMGVGGMCVIWFVVVFRSRCRIVTAVALPVCQESRKHRDTVFWLTERERDRLYGNTIRQENKQAGWWINGYRQIDSVDVRSSGGLFIAQTNQCGGERGSMLFAAHLPVCLRYK